jgi:hypothetical protein
MVASGEHADHDFGRRFTPGGYVTNPEVLKKQSVNLEGTEYGFWAQEGGSIEFFEERIDGVKAELDVLGYSAELLEVEPRIRQTISC